MKPIPIPTTRGINQNISKRGLFEKIIDIVRHVNKSGRLIFMVARRFFFFLSLATRQLKRNVKILGWKYHGVLKFENLMSGKNVYCINKIKILYFIRHIIFYKN